MKTKTKKKILLLVLVVDREELVDIINNIIGLRRDNAPFLLCGKYTAEFRRVSRPNRQNISQLEYCDFSVHRHNLLAKGRNALVEIVFAFLICTFRRMADQRRDNHFARISDTGEVSEKVLVAAVVVCPGSSLALLDDPQNFVGCENSVVCFKYLHFDVFFISHVDT